MAELTATQRPNLPARLLGQFVDLLRSEAAQPEFLPFQPMTALMPLESMEKLSYGDPLFRMPQQSNIPITVDNEYLLDILGLTAGGAAAARPSARAVQDLVRQIRTTPPTGAVTMGSKSAELSALKTRLDELNNQFATDTAPPSAVREHGAVMKRYLELQDELYPRPQTTPITPIDETAQGLLDTSYRGGHSAPNAETYGATLDSLEGVMPADVYSSRGKRLYGLGNPDVDAEWFAAAFKAKGKPDAEVTVYRAVPKGVKEINSGDWVTTSKTYADMHGERTVGDEYEILSKKVRAKTLASEGYPYEFGYNE